MTQGLKYGLLVVLALLLHSATMRAVAVVELPINPAQEECFLSQAYSVRHAFERFFVFYSTMPGELGHSDVSHVPTDKSIIRHFTRFREHKAMNDLFSDHLHTSVHSPADPVSYYVFGLRKIII